MFAPGRCNGQGRGGRAAQAGGLPERMGPYREPTPSSTQLRW
jgi:hypothetical protein